MKPTIEERFWAKVAKLESGCWEWQASKFWTGYGQFRMNGKNCIAHRVAYEFINGPLAQGAILSHRCESRACVNPEHLVLGLIARTPQAAQERFWPKVVKMESGCWEWQGSRFNTGYGQFSVEGKNRTAHRFSYEIANGAIPKGMFVCHKCDNPICVNPEHLFLGTPKDNTHDMIRKGRSTLRPRPAGPRGPYKKKQ